MSQMDQGLDVQLQTIEQRPGFAYRNQNVCFHLITNILKGIDYNASIVSKLLQLQNGPLTSLRTNQLAKNYSTKEEEVREDDKQTKDMESVLNDAVATAESGGKISCGAVSSTQKSQRKKKKSTRGKDNREEEKLADDIDYILKDDIPAAETKEQISSGTISTSLKVQLVKEYSIRQKDISDEEKLADNIEYILNDYIPAVKSKENVSSGTASSSKKERRAKKNSTREKNIT